MKIYTDGATSNNGYKGSRGGWAWVMVDEYDRIVQQGKGHLDEATNNQCELMALIRACHCAFTIDPVQTFEIYSDSAYCINCYEQEWWRRWVQNGWKNSKKEPVANRELWIKLIPFFVLNNFKFYKVKGHADDYWNNYVDRMAVEAKDLNA